MVYPPPFYFPLAYLFITPGVIFLPLISLSVQPEDGVGGQIGDGSRKDDFRLPPVLQHRNRQLLPAGEDEEATSALHTETLFPSSLLFPAPCPPPALGTLWVRELASSCLLPLHGQEIRAATEAMSSACLDTQPLHPTAA